MSVDYAEYFDRTGKKGVRSGGEVVVPIATARGEFRVWTKRTGNNPDVALLLLHGGPGATHEYFLSADSYLPAAGVERAGVAGVVEVGDAGAADRHWFRKLGNEVGRDFQAVGVD